MPRMRKPYGRRRVPAWKRRKFGRRPRRVNVNKALQPISQRYICKMKYSEVVTSSASGNYAFNLNSIFDPNRTGVGHQPYGHDTMLTLYNRYRVIACGWRIQGVVATAASPVIIGTFPGNEVVPFTTMSELKENPRAKWVCVSPGGAAVYLTGKSYIPSLVGRTKAQYMADDRYQAVMGADPLELAVLNIKTADGADNNIANTFSVTLEYTVEFFDIKHLAQS